MAQKTLITSGETSSTITDLGALADNLNEHVNASLSKAHGWTLIPVAYQDSGGCFHTNPVVGGNHAVMRIVIGTQVFFVPVQLSGGMDGHPDAIIPVNTGIVSPQSADPALDVTVGSPSITALTTAFTDILNAISAHSSALLFAHAGTPPESVHGGLTAQAEDTHDNVGHLVGHSTINILVNGVGYKLIGNKKPTGITQRANFIGTSIPQIIDHVTHDGDFFQVNAFTWKDQNPNGWHGAADYVLQIQVQGTTPMSYHWQFSADLVHWTNITDQTTYFGNAGFSFTGLPSAFYPGANWVTTPAYGTFYSSPQTLKLAIRDNGSHNNETNLAFAFRCQFDNSFIEDGAIVNSSYLVMQMKDTPSGGCF